MKGRIISTIFKTTAAAALIALTGCSLFVLEPLNEEDYLPTSLVIVVEKELYPAISSRIEGYRNDISEEGISSNLILWQEGNDCVELKSALQSYEGKAESGFFIGNLPPAWYEQTAFGKMEVFPSDLFYMDLDSVWTDSDMNGFYDSHSDIVVDFYISRLTGNADEINFYFDKLHNYRSASGETPVFDGAFIFKDDDWHNNYRGNDFGLDSIYSTVEFYQDENNTTRSAFLENTSANGFEYIYQWIHAFPPALFIDVEGDYEIIKADDIGSRGFNGNFYNLFDCQAARFTVKNIASNLITDTDSCIAILGSTKTGGVYYPVDFHKALGQGACWGAAYKYWYNNEGHTDDSWYLGIITMGDPAIRMYNGSGADLSSGSRSVSNLIPMSDEEKQELFTGLQDFSPPEDLPSDLREEIERSGNDY